VEANNQQSFGPTTLAGRVIFSGFTGLSVSDLPAIKAYDARDQMQGNRLLFAYPTKSRVDRGWSIPRLFRLVEWSFSVQEISLMARGAAFTP
jgi:hypothetical protein